MINYIISKKARIDSSVIVGSYSVIEEDVKIGANTKVGNYVIIKNGTVIGKGNTIHSGALIGVVPQDYHFKGEYSKCIIGDYNVIREYATISRATGENEETIIGDNNFVMTYVHVAHNSKIGNNVIISSGAQIGGHVKIEDFVNIGGLTGIHQFCRIGKYAMLGAKSYLNKDLAPYLLARGNPARVYGLNVKGLRRNLFSWQEIEKIKKVYRIIKKSPCNLNECFRILKKQKNVYTDDIVDFIEKSNRGILLHR